MLGRLRILAMAAAVAMASAASAQDRTVVVPSPIMVVDFEALFVETAYGQRISSAVTTERLRVQSENDRIAAELLAEETALTEARADMDPAAFRDAARAFNERAQAVRQDREAESTKLRQLLEAEQSQFLERVRPIILALMLERGAVVTMDRRAVYQAIGGANATQDAVALIDETVGDCQQNPDERPTLRHLGEPVIPEVDPIIADDPAPAVALPQDDLLHTE